MLIYNLGGGLAVGEHSVTPAIAVFSRNPLF